LTSTGSLRRLTMSTSMVASCPWPTVMSLNGRMRLKDSLDWVSGVSAAMLKETKMTEPKSNPAKKESTRGRILESPILIATPSQGILVVIDNIYGFEVKAFATIRSFLAVAALRKERWKRHWKDSNYAPLDPSLVSGTAAPGSNPAILEAGRESPGRRRDNRLFHSARWCRIEPRAWKSRADYWYHSGEKTLPRMNALEDRRTPSSRGQRASDVCRRSGSPTARSSGAARGWLRKGARCSPYLAEFPVRRERRALFLQSSGLKQLLTLVLSSQRRGILLLALPGRGHG